MNEQFNDKKLLRLLETLRANHPAAYRRTKKHIEMICDKIFIDAMEKTLFGIGNNACHLYRVLPSMRKEVAWYLDTPCGDSQSSYLVIAHNKSCATLYHLNTDQCITGRRYLLDDDGVADLLETFDGSFLLANDLFDEDSSSLQAAAPLLLDFNNDEEETDDDPF